MIRLLNFGSEKKKKQETNDVLSVLVCNMFVESYVSFLLCFMSTLYFSMLKSSTNGLFGPCVLVLKYLLVFFSVIIFRIISYTLQNVNIIFYLTKYLKSIFIFL